MSSEGAIQCLSNGYSCYWTDGRKVIGFVNCMAYFEWSKAMDEISKMFAMGSKPAGLIPAKDYALLWRVTPGRVAQMCRDGRFGGVKINGRWFIPISRYGRWKLERIKDHKDA